MAKKISLSELEKIERDGGKVVRMGDGQAFDTASVRLLINAVNNMTAVVDELKVMNQAIVRELRQFAPKEPNVTVKPQFKVDMPKRVGIRKWKHKVTKRSADGFADEIISTPQREKV